MSILFDKIEKQLRNTTHCTCLSWLSCQLGIVIRFLWFSPKQSNGISETAIRLIARQIMTYGHTYTDRTTDKC